VIMVDRIRENPFSGMLKQGLTIQSVSLTRVPDADDDLLEFQFGPDAAIRRRQGIRRRGKESSVQNLKGLNSRQAGPALGAVEPLGGFRRFSLLSLI